MRSPGAGRCAGVSGGGIGSVDDALRRVATSARMRNYALLLLPLLFPACSGINSTVKEGYAFKMSRAAAKDVVHGSLAPFVDGDRITFPSELTASGYDRVWTDTQTYVVSAIPAPKQDAFGFEISHYGTMFDGPSKAKRIYRSVVERAALSGERVNLR